MTPYRRFTYRTLVESGTSAAAGALSSPMLEQLTTQDGWGPASVQLQLTGHGLQLLPPSPWAPEPHASRQQSATSRLEKKVNLGAQTPCFRLDKVCPFPQGIAHSHLIASDGVSPLSLGRNKTQKNEDKRAPPCFMWGDKNGRRDDYFHTFWGVLPVSSRVIFFFFWSNPLPLKI